MTHRTGIPLSSPLASFYLAWARESAAQLAAHKTRFAATEQEHRVLAGLLSGGK